MYATFAWMPMALCHPTMGVALRNDLIVAFLVSFSLDIAPCRRKLLQGGELKVQSSTKISHDNVTCLRAFGLVLVVVAPVSVVVSAYRVHEDVNIRTAELAIENMLFLPQVECGTRTYDVEIVDTAGQDEFADFRNTALAQGDAFLVLFAINSPYSWGEVKQLRERIVLEHEDKDELPMVIVGNKKACVPVSLLLRYSFDIYFYVSGS